MGGEIHFDIVGECNSDQERRLRYQISIPLRDSIIDITSGNDWLFYGSDSPNRWIIRAVDSLTYGIRQPRDGD